DMAVLSDDLLMVAILAYCAAMVCHAAEYAFGARAAAHTNRHGAQTPVAAGATTGGGTAVLTAPPVVISEPSARRRPSWLPRTRLGLLAVASLLFAAVVHVATVVTRGLAAGRLPWGNMYEFILTATLTGVVVWLVVLYRFPAVRLLGLFLALVNMALL